MRSRLERFFYDPISARPLAWVRISLGLMMMIEAVSIYHSIGDLYGPYGFLQADLMAALSGFNLPSLAPWIERRGMDYEVLLRGVYWARWVFLGTFVIGWRTRLSTIALWILQSFIMSSGALSNYGIDRYFHLFLFLLIWMPAGEALSLDARRTSFTPSWRAKFSLRVLQFALLITYLNAGIAKMKGSEWWSGDAIWRVLHLPEFSKLTFHWMADWPAVPTALGWMTLVLETFYIVGVWIPRAGRLWTLAMIGMHLGIAVFMGLVNFGISMSLFNLALFLSKESK